MLFICSLRPAHSSVSAASKCFSWWMEASCGFLPTPRPSIPQKRTQPILYSSTPSFFCHHPTNHVMHSSTSTPTTYVQEMTLEQYEALLAEKKAELNKARVVKTIDTSEFDNLKVVKKDEEEEENPLEVRVCVCVLTMCGGCGGAVSRRWCWELAPCLQQAGSVSPTSQHVDSSQLQMRLTLLLPCCLTSLPP